MPDWLEIIVKPQLSAGWKYQNSCKQGSMYLPVVMSMSVDDNNKHVTTSSNPRLHIAKRMSVDIVS